MKTGIYEITEADKQRTVFKSYVMVYNGNIREKVWTDGVCKTRGEAERKAEKLLKELRQKQVTNKEDAQKLIDEYYSLQHNTSNMERVVKIIGDRVLIENGGEYYEKEIKTLEKQRVEDKEMHRIRTELLED